MTTQINSTEMAGLFAFVPAAAACGAAASRTRGRGEQGSRRWGVTAIINAVLAAETIAGIRYLAEDEIRDLLRRANDFSDRRVPQSAALVLVIATAIVISFVVVRSAANRAAAIASLATVGAITVFIVESVSLHGVDAVLYSHAGPILLIGWLWLACGWSTAIAAERC